ncbi:MAG: cob(I)yrinic acid a,c-diamide adenosyltransferase [Candidatus Paceibacterota bacterium]
MALFTGKGDDGTTKTFGCDQRISKSSAIAEALGSLDETNSFLGLVKVESEILKFKFQDKDFSEIIHTVQENLFIVQAELAGADKSIALEKVKEAEEIINAIEKELPPIKTFFISGGSKLAALFDISRTLARRAERRVVGVNEENIQKISSKTLAYLNRLSSLLYAFARLSNHLSGIREVSPEYK